MPKKCSQCMSSLFEKSQIAELRLCGVAIPPALAAWRTIQKADGQGQADFFTGQVPLLKK